MLKYRNDLSPSALSHSRPPSFLSHHPASPRFVFRRRGLSRYQSTARYVTRTALVNDKDHATVSFTSRASHVRNCTETR